MDFLKGLFENGAIDWDTFCKAVTDEGFKLADLSQGAYVSINKYNDDLGARDTQINDLKYLINDYKIIYIQPVDMFPQTEHIENIVTLERK